MWRQTFCGCSSFALLSIIICKYCCPIYTQIKCFLFQGEEIKARPENGFRLNKGNLIIQDVRRSSAGEGLTIYTLLNTIYRDFIHPSFLLKDPNLIWTIFKSQEDKPYIHWNCKQRTKAPAQVFKSFLFNCHK